MNKVVHFEIPVDDLERAKKFYHETFDWQMQDVPDMSYVIARTTETDKNHKIVWFAIRFFLSKTQHNSDSTSLYTDRQASQAPAKIISGVG